MTQHHPAPPTRRDRSVLVIAAALVIIGGLALYSILQARTQERDTAEKQGAEATEVAQTAVDYIAVIDADCRGRSGPEFAAALNKAGRCPQAAKIVQQEPLEPIAGKDGKDGDRGPGIVSSTIVGGDLVLTYSDGVVVNAGRVQGNDGRDGKDGKPGPGIVDADITDGGDLVVTLTNGTTSNLGRVVGTAGRDGKDGTTPDLTGYATEDWVRALIRALGCSITVNGNGPPLVLDCTVTGKP